VGNEQDDSAIGLDVYAKLFRGLGDRGRLAILLRLRDGAASAGELAEICRLSPSNASNHLRCLLACGLVTLEANGRHNVYRLSDTRVDRVLDASEALLASPAGALVKACCNYEPPSRRSLRNSAAHQSTRTPESRRTPTRLSASQARAHGQPSALEGRAHPPKRSIRR
jgi:ArsR family transcriptional regulator, cadmium/lead-responsive transcriptional repressor